MIIVFDLDDTLYNELTYVKSGLSSVAEFAFRNWNIPKNATYQFMIQTLEKSGRGHIFNELLIKYGKFSKANLRRCISVYRLHDPKINLYSDAKRCLESFKSLPIYIVTDGNKIVQHKKILALGLDKMVKKVFITYRHGLKNAKPSPYCFVKIAKIEKAKPQDIAYVGDNPKKDFIGIKPLGFKTIRILRGEHKDVRLSLEHDAHNEITSLDELPEKLKELENNERN